MSDSVTRGDLPCGESLCGPCPCRRARHLWSGLGLPFFLMLLAVVSLKCKRPSVTLETPLPAGSSSLHGRKRRGGCQVKQVFQGMQGAPLCLPDGPEGPLAAVRLRLLKGYLVARRLQLWREERHPEAPCWWLPTAASISS